MLVRDYLLAPAKVASSWGAMSKVLNLKIELTIKDSRQLFIQSGPDSPPQA